MEAKYDDLRSMGAEVVAISTDSHWAQRAYVATKGYRFPFLSDYGRTVAHHLAGRFDEVGPYRGVNGRRVMVVDQDRKVRWAWTAAVPSDVPDTEAVREAVQEVVYV